jgi:hypothetical protein
MQVATAPQDVLGAAMLGWHLSTDMKSGHETDCRLRRNLYSGKQ